jgi:glucuronate isomerase
VLFHDVAARLPIVDLHSHLSAADIAADRVYATLTDLWLGDDHYKWRAMRLAGHDERVITGDADPWERFAAWAATVPRLARNPLYLWTHLELRRVFGIDLPLSPGTAREIYEEANRQLPRWSARALLARFDVRLVATTDDPADDLAAHRALRSAEDAEALVVIPTFRPDPAHRLLDDPAGWCEWADRLGAETGVAVDGLESLRDALARSHARFLSAGARASDHGAARLPDAARDPARADAAIRSARRGTSAGRDGMDAALLEIVGLACELAFAADAVVQLHLGAVRDVSPRLRSLVGRDAGGDAIGDERQGPGLVRLLGELDERGSLPRLVLYNANPADNALFAALAGAFSRPGAESLVQWGPPWWFNDHVSGMRRALDDLSELGQLAGFVGMVTDSRSLLSFTRHELFRRVLCDALGRDVDAGLIPRDLDLLSGIVQDVCLGNALRHFSLPPLPEA